MRRVVVESPYRGNWFRRWVHRSYARMALRDCVMRGEAPIASHLLFTQPGVLRDAVAAERRMGIEAGHAWIPAADAVVVYADYGVSPGMQAGIAAARCAGVRIEVRHIISELPAEAAEAAEDNLHRFPWIGGGKP